MEKFIFSIQNLKDLMEVWEQLSEKVPFNVEFSTIRCKHCNSNQISKYGHYKGVQLWWCQRCRKKFTGNDAFPGMKIPFELIRPVLSMYFKGVPLSSIRKQMKAEFNYCPSDSTVYRWIRKTTEEALEVTKAHHPQVGNTWEACESTILVGRKKYWVSDLVDSDTHFLLASGISTKHMISDIKILIESAIWRAHKVPEKIITRSSSRYLKAIEQVMGLDFKRVQIIHPGKDIEIRFSIYWHHLLKSRSEIIHNRKSLDTVKLILNGWIINYNYFSTQRSLLDKTPAQVAGVGYGYEINYHS
jgi:transposase-like protein